MRSAAPCRFVSSGCLLATIVLATASPHPADAAVRPDDGPITEKEVAGRVVDAQGQPIAGATVLVYSWVPAHKTVTDGEGRFRLLVFDRPGADPREGAEMRIGKDGYGPKMFESVKGGTADLVVTLTDTTYFEGTVTGPDGRPVAEAPIRASSPHRSDGREVGKYWHETRTDADGHYRLYALPDVFDFQIRVPGVGAARRTGVEIAADRAKPLDIALARGVAFLAQVVDSQTEEPVAGVRLWHWQQPGLEGRSGDNGIVAIEDMLPGRFEFQLADFRAGTFRTDRAAYARWWSEQCVSEWSRRKIGELNSRHGRWQRNFDFLDFDLEPGMEPVRIVVERAVTIRGRVLDPDGRPVAGATVAPALTGSGNSLTGDTRFSVESDADGRYEMTLPASGEREYNLVAHDGKVFEWRKWANGVLDPIRTRPGEVLDGVDLRLTRPGTVRGRVLDPDGQPVADREVRAAAADLLENRYYDPTTRTDAQGRFELNFVRPGEQHIQAAPFWLIADQAPAGTSRAVAIRPGEAVEGIELLGKPEPRR